MKTSGDNRISCDQCTEGQIIENDESNMNGWSKVTWQDDNGKTWAVHLCPACSGGPGGPITHVTALCPKTRWTEFFR